MKEKRNVARLDLSFLPVEKKMWEETSETNQLIQEMKTKVCFVTMIKFYTYHICTLALLD